MEDKEICEICGEETDELYDTTGCINGGVGYVCDQCIENNDIGVSLEE